MRKVQGNTLMIYDLGLTNKKYPPLMEASCALKVVSSA